MSRLTAEQTRKARRLLFDLPKEASNKSVYLIRYKARYCGDEVFVTRVAAAAPIRALVIAEESLCATVILSMVKEEFVVFA